MTRKNPLDCIVCLRELAHVPADMYAYRDVSQPYDGITVSSHGNYGSRILDSINEDRIIECVICDDCLLHAIRQNTARFMIKSHESMPRYVVDTEYRDQLLESK